MTGPYRFLDAHRVLVNTAPWPDRGPDVTVPATRLPCVVTARFEDGYVGRVRGSARAWTPRAVEVVFSHPDPAVQGQYVVWIGVGDVTSDLGVLDEPASAIGSDN